MDSQFSQTNTPLSQADLFRRLVAFIVDGILLFGFLFVVGTLIQLRWSWLGDFGVCLGFLVVWGYFVFFDSVLGQGQTIGKRLLKLQVLRMDGAFVPIGPALLRALFFVWFLFPMYEMFSLLWPEHFILGSSPLPLVFTFVDFAMATSFATFLPFHPDKRGVHDLLTKSVVIEKPPFSSGQNTVGGSPEKVRRAFLIWGLFCMGSGGVAWKLSSLWSSPTLLHAGEILADIRQNTDVQNPGLFEIKSRSFSSRNKAASSMRFLQVTGYLSKDFFSNADGQNEQFRSIVHILKKNPDWMRGVDKIRLVFRTGVSLGWVRLYRYSTHDYLFQQDPVTTSEWEQRVVPSKENLEVLKKYYEIAPTESWSPGSPLYRKAFNEISENYRRYRLSGSEYDSTLATRYAEGVASFHDELESFDVKDVLDEWCRQEPNTDIPWLIRGNFYIQYAWAARGNRWSNEVREKAWPLFEERLKRAQADLERAHKINPNNPDAPAALLIVARGLQLDENRANGYYQQALAAFPPHLKARLNWLERLKAKWEGSDAEMWSYARECQREAPSHPLLGLVLISAHKEMANRQTTSRGSYWVNADVWRDVQAVYEPLLKAFPEAIEFQLQFAQLAWHAEKYDVAKAQLDHLGKKWMNQGSAWAGLSYYNSMRTNVYSTDAWDYLKNNNLEEGVLRLNRIIEYNPWDTWVLAKLAECHRRWGHWPEAKAFAERALAYSPPPDDKAQAESVLAEANRQLVGSSSK